MGLVSTVAYSWKIAPCALSLSGSKISAEVLVYLPMLPQNRDLIMAKHSTVTPRPYHCDIGVFGARKRSIIEEDKIEVR
jgi:hypothetical protein